MRRTKRRTQETRDASRHYTNEFTRCDWISGRDLSRYLILEELEDGNLMRFLVRRLEASELIGRCDACVRRHSFNRLRCSMNRADGKWEPEPAFYRFADRVPILGVWRQVEAVWRENSVGEETWRRVKPRAGTKSGAFMIAAV